MQLKDNDKLIMHNEFNQEQFKLANKCEHLWHPGKT